MAHNKIAAHYNDGKMAKGSTQNFDANTRYFHLTLDPAIGAQDDVARKTVEIVMRDLKAIFFVNEFAGKPDYEEKKDFSGSATTLGRRIQVTFNDGEVFVGTTMNYDPGGIGFFAIPADPESNNKRVFIINSSVKDMKLV